MRSILVFGAVLLFIGCDHGQRITRLEKQATELQQEIKRADATTDYELQTRCARDAKEWYSEHTARGKETVYLDYVDHYNKARNKCFIVVEQHDVNGPVQSTDWMTLDMQLWDVYENAKYGDFTGTRRLGRASTALEIVDECEFLQTKCKSLDEFNGLLYPYMNN